LKRVAFWLYQTCRSVFFCFSAWVFFEMIPFELNML